MSLANLLAGRGKWVLVGSIALLLVIVLAVALPLSLRGSDSKPSENSVTAVPDNTSNSTVPVQSNVESEWLARNYTCQTSTMLDMVVFGDQASERNHNFYGPGSSVKNTTSLPLQFPQAVTSRVVMPDAENTQNGVLTGNQSTLLNITVAVHPSKLNYITLKLYGSDSEQGGIFLFWRPPEQPVNERLYPGMISIGAGLLQLSSYNIENGDAAGLGGLDMTERGPNPYPRHFYYSTMIIPPSVTANRTVLNILLGGWSYLYSYSPPRLRPLYSPLKPIYRAYIHLDPFFSPLPSPNSAAEAANVQQFEPHTEGPAPRAPPMPVWNNHTRPVSTKTLQDNIDGMKRDMNNGLNVLLGAQVWGPAWKQAMKSSAPSDPYAVPDILWGAKLSTDLLTKNLSTSQWLNAAAASVDPAFVGSLALSYSTPWHSYYKNITLIERAVAATDFLMYAACLNHGWKESASVWYGAPNRAASCSGFDGYGPYSLAIGIYTIADTLDEGGYLDVLVDPELNGTQITRRQAWWNMLGNYATTVFYRRRGGCPNQDLFQSMAMVSAQLACKALDKSRPPPFTDELFSLMLNQSAGFAPSSGDPRKGAWFTEDGMVMECGGVGMGGMDGNYGPVAGFTLMYVVAALRLMDNTGKYNYIHERMARATDHLSYLVYPTYQEDDTTAPLGSHKNKLYLVTQTTINTRVEHIRDMRLSNMATVAWYMAAQKHPYSLRILQMMLQYGHAWTSIWPNAGSVSYNLILWPYIEKAVEEIYDPSSFTDATLITELSVIKDSVTVLSNNSATVEITAAAVILRYGDDRMWINMNYRHAYNQVNNYARILHHAANTSRVATAYFKAYDGYNGLWTLQYGPYFIAINRQFNQTYTFGDLNYATSSPILGELISRATIDTANSSRILAPRSAWVLVSPKCEFIEAN